MDKKPFEKAHAIRIPVDYEEGKCPKCGELLSLGGEWDNNFEVLYAEDSSLDMCVVHHYGYCDRCTKTYTWDDYFGYLGASKVKKA